MSNVVSIFSGEEPCQNMEISNDLFWDLIAKEDEGLRIHLNQCRDCGSRFSILARANLAKMIESGYDLEDIHDD